MADFGKDRPIVLVTTRLFDEDAVSFLEKAGCRVRRSGLADDELDTLLPASRIRELLEGARGWIVGLYPVDAPLLDEFPALEIVSRRGVGYDTVDVEAARARGRIVAIATGGNEPSVADHASAMILALGRRLCESDRILRSGAWKTLVARELRGGTLGLVGLGQIARGVVERLRPFGPRFVAADPSVGAREWAGANGVEMVDLETLLETSDVVSLHAPLLPATRHLVDERALSRMKRSAFLVNTSRGGLIDDAALLAALRKGRIAGAALDVFESEDDPSRLSVTQGLLTCPNFIGTAHAGGSSIEGLARANLIAAENVLAVLRGHPLPPHRVVVGRERPAAFD